MSTQQRIFQPIAAIEGIGRERSSALAEKGIETLADLLASRPTALAEQLERVSPASVAAWQSHAALMQVEGVTPDLAEALVDAGIESVAELADAGLQTVERAFDRAVERGRLAEAPSIYGSAEL